MEIELGTRETAAIAGFGLVEFRNVIDHGQYPAAPIAPGRGRERMFTCDDVVGVFVLRYFSDLGLSMKVAGRVAAAVRHEMRKHGDIEHIWIVMTSAGQPVSAMARNPGPGRYSHQIPIRLLRLRVIEIATAKGIP